MGILITLNVKKHMVTQAMPQHQNQILMNRSSCYLFGGIRRVWSTMDCYNRMKPLTTIAIDCNWCVWTAHWRINSQNTWKGKTNWFFNTTTFAHLLQVVKAYLEMLKEEVLPHTPYPPDVAPSDYHLFRLMTHGLSEKRFTSNEDCQKWVDSLIASKDKEILQVGIRKLLERWGKIVANDGQYFKKCINSFYNLNKSSFL